MKRIIFSRHFPNKILLAALPLVAAIFFATGVSLQAQKKETPTLKFGEPLPANAFIELAKLANPAVVNISTATMPKGGLRRGPQDPLMEMLQQFYGMEMMPSQVRPMQALGSGFIIRDDGLIITNHHVVAGADKILVQISEKAEKQYEAKLIGSDERTDIALIKIEGKGYPTLQLGSSTSTQIGEWVAAFGNPFGNGHTITKGIISAKGRELGEINRFPMMQTDAPINPGNSGGPLMNTKGEVIGVNSAILERAQGIGFAIPIDDVKSVLPQLEKHGKIKKAYFGVGLADLDPRAALELGIKGDEGGAIILQVEAGAPASKAGVQKFDVVTEFNGKKIHNSRDLQDSVAAATIGSSVPLKLIRDGKTKTLNVTMAERPENPLPKKTEKSKGHLGQKAPHNLGFQVADVTDALRKEYDLDPDVKRPIIVAVEPGSNAAAAGLLPGDLLLDVNRKSVNSAGEIPKLLKKGTNMLSVYRQGLVLLIMLKSE